MKHARTRKLTLLALAALCLTGCAVRNRQGIRALVNPSCLTKPIVMQDCDFSIEQLRCRSVKLSYRAGCEQLQVNADNK